MWTVLDLFARSFEPSWQELDKEVNSVLYSAYQIEEFASKDSQIVGRYIKKRLEPALLYLLFLDDNNFSNYTCHQLIKSNSNYQTLASRLIRPQFVRRRAEKRLHDHLMLEYEPSELKKCLQPAKMLLTLISYTLSDDSSRTLFEADGEFTDLADLLYSCLKRTLVGDWNDNGLKSHVRNCGSLMEFISDYARRKKVEDVSINNEKPVVKENFLSDIKVPILFLVCSLAFLSWRRSRI